MLTSGSHHLTILNCMACESLVVLKLPNAKFNILFADVTFDNDDGVSLPENSYGESPTVSGGFPGLRILVASSFHVLSGQQFVYLSIQNKAKRSRQEDVCLGGC